MSEGIAIARTGVDRNKAQFRDEVLDSRLATLPIALQQSFSLKIPSGGRTATITIPHGLSFAPIFKAWADEIDLSVNPAVVTGKRLALPVIKSSGVYQVYTDNTNVYVNIQSTAIGYAADRDLTFNGYLYVFSKRFQ